MIKTTEVTMGGPNTAAPFLKSDTAPGKNTRGKKVLVYENHGFVPNTWSYREDYGYIIDRWPADFNPQALLKYLGAEIATPVWPENTVGFSTGIDWVAHLEAGAVAVVVIDPAPQTTVGLFGELASLLPLYFVQGNEMLLVKSLGELEIEAIPLAAAQSSVH